MATSAPSGSGGVEVDLARRRRWRPRPPWPGGTRWTGRARRPSCPRSSSRVEPSGRRTEMTPAIVHPFLLSRRDRSWSGRRRATKGTGPPRAAPDRRSEVDAEQARPVGDRTARRGLVVERAQRGGRVEVVVERAPAPPPSPARRRRPRRSRGARRHSASRAAAAGMSSSVRHSQSLAVVVGRAGPGARRPASHSLHRSPTKTRLPSDFDIFVPSRPDQADVEPVAGRRACPVTDSDWAASHSWCGKTRSRPPPWMSMVSPSSRSARAEHSMCHPGRPGPQRDSQAGSSGSEGCHSTKSSGSRLLGSSGFPPCSAASSSMSGAVEAAEPTEAREAWSRRSRPTPPDS